MVIQNIEYKCLPHTSSLIPTRFEYNLSNVFESLIQEGIFSTACSSLQLASSELKRNSGVILVCFRIVAAWDYCQALSIVRGNWQKFCQHP